MKHIAFLLLPAGALLLTALGAVSSPALRAGNHKAAAAAQVTVDAAKRHQTIDGFGTCLVSWQDRMAAWYHTPEAARIYADDLRFNILRCNLWGDGTIGPVEDPERIRHTDPDFAKSDPRTPVFLQFAKAVQAYNPSLKVIGTVWSPPAWMKENGRITDSGSGAIDGATYAIEVNGVKQPQSANRVRRERYPHFARWLVEMVKHYEKNGVRMYAVSAANEPQFTQSFESCVWTAKDLATITGMTGALLEKDGLGRVKLFGPETMTGFNWENGPNYRYTSAMREDPLAWKALGFWATHGYADGVKGDVSSNSSAKFWSIIAGDKKPYWVTEGGTGGHNWPEPVGEKGVGIAIHNAFVAGNASAFVPWQYAEPRGSEHNLMPTSGPNKKTHVVRHYSRYIPAGSVRVDATPAYGVVNASAFVKDNDVTVVLLNTTSEAQSVTLTLRGLTAPAPDRLNVVRTSATEDSAELTPVSLRNGSAEVEVPGPGIVTLSTLR